MPWMLRVLWLVIAYDLQRTETRMTSQAECFFVFPSTAMSKYGPQKKVQQEFFKSKKRGETKKYGKNICDTLSCGSWVTFFVFLPHFGVISD